MFLNLVQIIQSILSLLVVLILFAAMIVRELLSVCKLLPGV